MISAALREIRTMLLNIKTQLPAAHMLDRQVEGEKTRAWRG